MWDEYHITNVRNLEVPADKLAVYWLGGAGFVVKFDNGTIICIDPYLSDSVERLYGFKRLSLAPVIAEELIFDILLFTHDHGDHLDIDSFDTLMKVNPQCKIVAPGCCDKYLSEKNKQYECVVDGKMVRRDGLEITAVEADHGQLCQDAVGFIVKCGQRSIYFTGDTCYSDKIISKVNEHQPEIIVVCINGAFGNMDAVEAAGFVSLCHAKSVIPAHFWLFAEHGGEPAKFIECVKKDSSKINSLLLTPGRGVKI